VGTRCGRSEEGVGGHRTTDNISLTAFTVVDIYAGDDPVNEEDPTGLTTTPAPYLPGVVTEFIPISGWGIEVLVTPTGESGPTSEINPGAPDVNSGSEIFPIVQCSPLTSTAEPLPTQVPRQTAPLTNAQATDLARYLGYRPINQIIKGERVFTNGRTYIVQDTTSHSGGTWKIATTVGALRTKVTRSGTTDPLLTPIGR
jgi:hypothetical protein